MGRRSLIRGLGLLGGAFAGTRLGFGAQMPVSGPIIDAQSHLHGPTRGRNGREMAGRALRLMDRFGVEGEILVPPPLPPDHFSEGLQELAGVARQHPTRFAFVGGGDSLNPLILGTPADQVSAAAMQRFVATAVNIAGAGAAGFGELAVEHFGSSSGRPPYESAPADHPMLLALADVAARHDMPVGLHMEAVPRSMPFPPNRTRGAGRPPVLNENITALERLLEHNASARIVWLHAGWDLTGERTVALMRGLLGRHPNLFMTVKSDRHGERRTSPFLPGFSIKPGWLAMFRAFPDRFAVGSDQFFDERPERIERARKLIDALPPDLARLIGRENVRRIYRLPSWT